MGIINRQLRGKRVYLYTVNSNQLDPFASELTIVCSEAKGSNCLLF